MNKLFVAHGKAMVMDDNHWVTINGKHVLINEEGEVQAGLGGKLNGMKISKATSTMKGGKFKTAKTEQRELIDKHNKRNDAMINRVEKIKKEGAKKDSAYTKAINRVNRLEREADKKKDFDKADRLWKLREDLEQARSDNYNANNDKWHRLASKARENTKRTEKQIGEIDKKYKKAGEALSSARGKIKSAREANSYIKERGTKISKATPDMVGGKFSNYQKEAKQHVDEFSQKSRRLDREDKKSYEQYRKEFDQLNKEEEALNKSKKGLGYSRRLGNAAIRLARKDGQKYKPLIERIGQRQNQLNREWQEEHNELDRRAMASTERHNSRAQANANELNKAASEMNAKIQKSARKFDKAGQALAKARPKIAERREAIRKAVKNGTGKKILESTRTFNGQPFRVMSYGGNGQNALHGIILKSDEETAKKYGDRYAARWIETWQMDKK